MTATNIFYNFVGFRYSPPLSGDHSYACRYNLHSMHAVITPIACNSQPASLAPTMDALLRAVASGEYGSDTRTDLLKAWLEQEKLMFVTSPFLDQNFTSNTGLEWQAQHSPILLSPDSSDSMLRRQYPVLSLPAMH